MKLQRIFPALLLCSLFSGAAGAAGAAFHYRIPLKAADAAPAHLVVSPSSLDFGTLDAGQTSPMQEISLANEGGRAAVVQAVNVPAGFLVQGDCSSLAPAAQCNLQVRFAPAAPANYSGLLTIVQDSGQVHPVALAGVGETVEGSSSALSASSASHAFGAVGVGEESPPWMFQLRNDESKPVTVSSLQSSDGFPVEHNCGPTPFTLAGSASCAVIARFAPASRTAPGAGLIRALTAQGQTLDIPLSGVPAWPVMSLSASTLDFGVVPKDGVPVSRTLTLRNDGNWPLDSVTTSAVPRFAVNNCSVSVPAGGTCLLTVTHVPSVVGKDDGTLMFTAPKADSVSVVLAAETGEAKLEASPTSLTIWELAYTSGVDSRERIMPVTVRNTGNVAGTLALGVAAGNGFSVNPATSTCSVTLAAGASCQVGVKFAPSISGIAFNTLSISPGLSIPLKAYGTAGVPLQIFTSTSTLDFGAVPAGQTVTKWVTLRNVGYGPITVTGAEITPGFVLTGNYCGEVPGSGGTCSVEVTYTATAQGPTTGTVRLSTSTNDFRDVPLVSTRPQ